MERTGGGKSRSPLRSDGSPLFPRRHAVALTATCIAWGLALSLLSVLSDNPTSPARQPRRAAPGLAAFLAAIGVAAVAWLAVPGRQPTIPVAFIQYAVATVSESAAIRSTPVGGETVAVLAPGDRFSVGGRLPMLSGLVRADVVWVAVNTESGVLHGYLPEAVVVTIAGEAPILRAGGIPIAAPERVVAAGSSAQRAVGIPWLPESMQPWLPLISAAGATYGVDPDLLAIISLVESGGNPRVVSRSGAVGLMQIMPTTAEDIAQQRGIAGFSVEQLVEPGLNIDFGAYYLASMLRQFGESEDNDWRTSVDRAAAAYNAGPGSVDRWLRQSQTLPGETERYRRYVGGMWAERHSSDSATYAEWLAAGGWRLVDPDGGPPEVGTG